MEVVKKTSDYTVYQKRSKRYAVKNADSKWVNGAEKVEILVKESLVKAAVPKPKEEEAPAEEAPAEEAGTEEAAGGE